MLQDFIIGLLLGILSMMPVFPDPYHHSQLVCFWVWLYRELDELISGEKR